MPAGYALGQAPIGTGRLTRPAIRATPRPIVTWFEVADRPVIRRMISRVTAGSQAQMKAQGQAHLQRSDRTRIPVLVRVNVVADVGTGQLGLQWELEAKDTTPTAASPGRPAKLWVVPEPDSAAGQKLAGDMITLAAELAGCETEEQLLEVGIQRIRRLVPGAEHAGVLLLRRRGALSTDASADELALAL